MGGLGNVGKWARKGGLRSVRNCPFFGWLSIGEKKTHQRGAGVWGLKREAVVVHTLV